MSLVMLFADPAQGSIQMCGVWLLALRSQSGTACHPFWRVQTSNFTEGSSAWICLVVPMWLGAGYSDWEGRSASPSGTGLPHLPLTVLPWAVVMPSPHPGLCFRHLVPKGLSPLVPQLPGVWSSCACPWHLEPSPPCWFTKVPQEAWLPSGRGPCRPLRTVTQLLLGVIAPPPSQWAELDTSRQQGPLAWL